MHQGENTTAEKGEVALELAGAADARVNRRRSAVPEGTHRVRELGAAALV